MSHRDELSVEIRQEEDRIASLRQEIEEHSCRLAMLQEEMESLHPEYVIMPRVYDPASLSVPKTNTEKVALFRSLFHGREDVFPRRWENQKNGRSGYSPACANERVSGLCDKRHVKCGECPNRVFIPVSDQVVIDHFKGRHVIGVYPMLPDETCWFLAADFDKASWQEDVSAFAETCGKLGVPVAIERSRSGNGAHAWFFFMSPVPAVEARKFGCFLITETMSRRHQLSMESYDRLFPNQDTMPKGGFGNLIALPLQLKAREHGNSVFVDALFKPFPDQWAFLSGVRRLDATFVHNLVSDAGRRGRVIGVNTSDPMNTDDSTPWNRKPSGSSRKIVTTESLPKSINAVLCQRLFIEKSGAPSALLSQIMRLAAFQNPEFYKKQRMRLSIHDTPRVISCAEDLPEHIALPRGCVTDLDNLLQDYGIKLLVEDKRNEGDPLDVTFHGKLTSVQEAAATALLDHDTGVFVGPPGIGKTVLGTYLLAKRRRNTLVLVHRQHLLDQWLAQISMFLEIDEKKIGQIGGGKNRLNGQLDVAMLQSLSRKDIVDDRVAGYGLVIVDECHHLPAFSFERVLNGIKARYIVGLTATPQRRDGRHPILQMQLGPVRFYVDPKSQAARRPFDHKLIVRETGFQSALPGNSTSIQGLYTELVNDQRRNDMIFDDVVHALEEKRSPILLTERRDHLEHFEKRLRNFTRHLIVLHGGMKTTTRREALKLLASIPDGEERLIIATGKYIGEGFDDPRLDTLFLTLPVSWKGTIIQYSGRVQRLHPGKTEVRIYDYVDRDVPMLMNMFEKRLREYRAIGYAREEAPLGYAPPPEEPTIERDEEAIKYSMMEDGKNL